MRNFVVEFIGTALLLAVVTGSGVMGESLAQGNVAVALLGNSIATGAGLYVLISLLGPLTGAHFNPVVSFMFWAEKALETSQLIRYITAQITGAVAGVWLTHAMFGLPILQLSDKPRSGVGLAISEFIATLVLLGVIRLGVKQCGEKVPLLVALIVTAGYWFTSSTFFCNPAVTIARSLTNTFVGIQWENAPMFIGAQLAALGVFIALYQWLKKAK